MPRRRFLGQCGIGLGRMALASLLAEDARSEDTPLAPKTPHFPAHAKSIIYLFMEGGPSQLDLFVDKPKLKAMNGQEMPKSLLAGKKFAFMEPDGRAQDQWSEGRVRAGTARAAMWFRAACRSLAGVVDDIAILNAVKTNNVNHSPAMVYRPHRRDDSGPSQPGRVAGVRTGQRVEESAGLRRHAERAARTSQRDRYLGQRLSADHVSRRSRSSTARSRSSI